MSACNDAWTDSVALLRVDAAALVNKHADNIISQLTKSPSLSQVCLSVSLFADKLILCGKKERRNVLLF